MLSVHISLGSITTVQLFHSTVSILGPHIQLCSSQFHFEQYGFYFPTGMGKRRRALWVQSVEYELQSTDSQNIHEGHYELHIIIALTMDPHDSL